MISIILPAYNEEKMIQKSADAICAVLQKAEIAFEIIFVNDGSTDGTWQEIQRICKQDKKISGIRFSKNFGKEAAILAGLSYAGGDCCVIMDCDLQHPPSAILQMYQLWKNGYEVVEGIKASRGKESILHKFAASVFYKLISHATGIDMSRASDFKLMDRKAVDALLALPERHTFFRALSSWIGFRSTTIEFHVQERMDGVSKWSTLSLIRYALTNITSFSTLPLHLATDLGIAFFVFSIIFTIHSLYKYITGQALEGFTTVIILLLIATSVLMTCLGIIGYYLAKIYEEVQARPRYIVSETTQTTSSHEIHNTNI